MKRAVIFSLFAALLGGCVVLPYGYRDYDDGYRSRGYSGSYYRHGYPAYPGYYGYGYPGYYGYGGFRYRDRGG
ncbi:MAG: hypothetical protein M3R31_03920 [Pseudomonadota bacterium]|nr:hypothetical protein [Pseudomonadota bacterium]